MFMLNEEYLPENNSRLKELLKQKSLENSIREETSYGALFVKNWRDKQSLLMILNPGAHTGVLSHKNHSEERVEHLGFVSSVRPSINSLRYTTQINKGIERDPRADLNYIYSDGDRFVTISRSSRIGYWHGYENLSGKAIALYVEKILDKNTQ